jgi:hypothetical protein
MDGRALPGAEEGDSTAIERGQGVRGFRGKRALADDDCPGPGPAIKPRGVGGLASVMRDQHQVDRPGLCLGDQLDDAQLIQVTRGIGVRSI